MAKCPFFREKQAFITKFVQKETLSWPREMKIANQLWAQYPNPEFWIIFELPFKLNSLAWLIGDGKTELQRQWNFFKLDKARKMAMIDTSKYSLSESAMQSAQILKPRTMKDWMNQSVNK
jgi:hypothetical protein